MGRVSVKKVAGKKKNKSQMSERREVAVDGE